MGCGRKLFFCQTREKSRATESVINCGILLEKSVAFLLLFFSLPESGCVQKTAIGERSMTIDHYC